MILALIVVAISFVVGLTFLATSTTAMGTSRILIDHSKSRQIAESGIEMTLGYIEQSPDWLETVSPGILLEDYPINDGTLTVEADFSAVALDDPSLINFSFEDDTAWLSTPALFPPMSGSIGGWNIERTALVQTGLTVPLIGMVPSAFATDGTNAAIINFSVLITGGVTLSQTLSESLEPNTLYEISADISNGSRLAFSAYGFRLFAGSDLVASSAHASTLEIPSVIGVHPDDPDTPPGPNECESLLSYIGLVPGNPSKHTLTFTTDESPLSGFLTLELYAYSTGLLASITFDNISIAVRNNNPVEITAIGVAEDSSHVITAQVISQIDGSTQIVQWNEP